MCILILVLALSLGHAIDARQAAAACGNGILEGCGTFSTPAALGLSIQSGTADDEYAEVATDGRGVWITAWTERKNGNNIDVLVQRSTDDAVSWQSPARLSITTASGGAAQDRYPGVATDGQGNWLVVWQSTGAIPGSSGNDFDIACAASTDNGATWSTPRRVNSNATDTVDPDERPHVAHDGTKWVVVWQSKTFSDDYDVVFATSSNLGVTWSNLAAVNSASTTDTVVDGTPRISINRSTGIWLVAWVLYTTPAIDDEIRFATSANGGQTWTTAQNLNTNAAGETALDQNVRIAAGASETWLAVWQTQSNPGGTLGTDWDVVFSKGTTSTAGTVTWSAPAPVTSKGTTDGGNSDGAPDVVFDGLGSWIVAWHTNTNVINGTATENDYDLIYATSSNEGATWTGPKIMNRAVGDGGDDQRVRLASDRRGRWVAAWDSGAPFATSPTINKGSDLDPIVARLDCETCDDGNTSNLDYCRGDCRLGVCGDGNLQDCALPATPVGLGASFQSDTATDEFTAVATDRRGTWLAAWTSTQGTTPSDVKIQRSTTDGATWQAAQTLSVPSATGGTAPDALPAIATDLAGNWLVVWQTQGRITAGVGADLNIAASLSADNGATWSVPRLVNSNAIGSSAVDERPQIVHDGKVWLVVWQSRFFGGDLDIAYASSTNNGTTWTQARVVEKAGVPESPIRDDHTAKVGVDPASGRWLVAWVVDDPASLDDDLRYASSADAGGTWSTVRNLNTNAATDSAHDQNVSITNGSGAGGSAEQWLAVWQTQQPLQGSTSQDWDVVYARGTLNAQSEITWTAPAYVASKGLNDGGGSDGAPAAVFDGFLTWLVAWHTNTDVVGGISTGADYDLMYAVSRDAGVTWRGPRLLNRAVNDGGDDLRVRLATSHRGRWVAVWDSAAPYATSGIVNKGTDSDIISAALNCETCDDANLVNTDACSNVCALRQLCRDAVATGTELCDDGDNVFTDTCVFCTPAVCGDGFLCTDTGCATGPAGGGETCDDADTTSGDGCDANCSATGCGNGIKTAGEACDDGNAVAGDGCEPSCTVTPSCGNGTVSAPEECDDADSTNGDGCDNNCTFTACGNGIKTAGEGCDDGNLEDGDGCSGVCLDTGTCGNGIVEVGEDCDDGGTSNGNGCNSSCRNERCGDGLRNNAGTELCDDGNTDACGACSADCSAPGIGNATCGDGIHCASAGEQCDRGAAAAFDCDVDCTLPECGDGLVNTQAGEECETDTNCDVNCTLKGCGNGVVNVVGGFNEQCDDAGESTLCDANCTRSYCGDQVVNQTAGEECDDGNQAGGDGCRRDCTEERCGDGLVDAGEGCDDPLSPCCNPTTCQPVTAGTACNDGNLCTKTDVCIAGGVCRGVADASKVNLACTSGDGCVHGTCNSAGVCNGTYNSVAGFVVQADDDNDGLPNCWETRGIDANCFRTDPDCSRTCLEQGTCSEDQVVCNTAGVTCDGSPRRFVGACDGTIDLDLRNYDANLDGIITSRDRPDPRVPDVYVEFDFMQSHQPPYDEPSVPGRRVLVAKMIESAFARGNHVSAATGTAGGVRLHVQVDPAQPIPHSDELDAWSGTAASPFNPVTDPFAARWEIKRRYFGTAAETQAANAPYVREAKRHVFRYALIHHRGGFSSAEGKGDDFKLIDGQTHTPDRVFTGKGDGGFMHELGHTMALGHGGNENVLCKPNYTSVMNSGQRPPGLVSLDRQLDYSRIDLPDLNEALVCEADGLTGGNPAILPPEYRDFISVGAFFNPSVSTVPFSLVAPGARTNGAVLGHLGHSSFWIEDAHRLAPLLRPPVPNAPAGAIDWNRNGRIEDECYALNLSAYKHGICVKAGVLSDQQRAAANFPYPTQPSRDCFAPCGGGTPHFTNGYCECAPQQCVVQANGCCEGCINVFQPQLLRGFDDWDSLQFNFRTSALSGGCAFIDHFVRKCALPAPPPNRKLAGRANCVRESATPGFSFVVTGDQAGDINEDGEYLCDELDE